MTTGMQRLLYVLVSLLGLTLFGCGKPQQPAEVFSEDPELAKLEAAVLEADSNAEMKATAGDVGDYWDRRMAAIETRSETRLDEPQRVLFRAMQKAWREYRAAEVAYQTDFYRGGSMQGLIANQTYAELTEARVRELERDEQETKGGA
jgi:uncharacterized protein YecT (DUF1311 family)